MEFELAADLTDYYEKDARCHVPVQVLFPQMLRLAQRFIAERVKVVTQDGHLLDAFLPPYYGRIVEILTEKIEEGDKDAPELPRYEPGRETGSTKDVDFWTSKKEPYETTRSHVNYMVPDSKWESQVAYALDQHENVVCYVKNKGLGFAVPYLHGGQLHEFLPDFLVRLQWQGEPVGMMILEPRGYDKLAEAKTAAAARWCKAVNTEGKQPLPWAFEMFSEPGKVNETVSAAASSLVRDVELCEFAVSATD